MKLKSVVFGVSLTIAGAALAQGDLPEPSAEAVWNYLQEQNYEQWSFWPGKEGFYEGTRPHGAKLKTYVNSSAEEALKDFNGTLPAGSIVVKENYSPEEELAAVTVMYKPSEGYNPEHNDWFWLKRQADGTIDASGKVESCQACHQGAENGYLFTEIP